MSDTKRHILIIEDSINILQLLEMMLEFEDWKVSTLKSLDNILDNVNTIKPDIILSDMLLSGANGCDACAEIKNQEHLKQIPYIIMSAHPEAHIDAKNAGADYFIDKPFEMAQMVGMLNKAWEERSL